MTNARDVESSPVGSLENDQVETTSGTTCETARDSAAAVAGPHEGNYGGERGGQTLSEAATPLNGSEVLITDRNTALRRRMRHIQVEDAYDDCNDRLPHDNHKSNSHGSIFDSENPLLLGEGEDWPRYLRTSKQVVTT